MSASFPVAATLSADTRKEIGLQVLADSEPVSHIAANHAVSRNFVYQQGTKAQQALDESFAPSPRDDEVMFYLPVTKSWLFQLILALVLICHSYYRGVVELLRDLFDVPMSVGTMHNPMSLTKAESCSQLGFENRARLLHPRKGFRTLLNDSGFMSIWSIGQ